MKRYVVEVETAGRRQTRLVPAKDEATARRNCTTDKSKVISCVPYAGQKVEVSGQFDDSEGERLTRGFLAANRRKKGGYTKGGIYRYNHVFSEERHRNSR